MADRKPWEEFSAPQEGTPEEQKPWEAFGGITKPDGKGLTGHARDLGLSALKSAIAVPETVVGLADIPTGGAVGKFLENKDGAIGFRPKEARDILSDLHTDQYKAQQREFQDAEGVIDKTAVALKNPSLIANTVVESAAPMLAGGVAARGIRAVAPAVSAAAAGAIGEGATMAGAQAEGIRQETDDGLLTPQQSGAAVATGALGTLFGYAGGRLAQKLGIGDVDTMLARGAATSDDVAAELARTPAKSIPRQVVEGAISEGFLEELPQSISEQIIQNLALNKPWSEGIEDAAVMGTLAGMAMGGGASLVQSVTAPPRSDSQTVAPPQAEPRPDLFSTGDAPVLDDRALERAGVTPPPPAPVLNPEQLDRWIDPSQAPALKPSEQMGLDPAAGPMSAAAALAVDSGASPVAPPAAAPTQTVPTQPNVNPETGEIVEPGARTAEQPAQSPEQMRERLAFIEQQARMNGGWDRRLVEERGHLQAALAKAEPAGAAGSAPTTTPPTEGPQQAGAVPAVLQQAPGATSAMPAPSDGAVQTVGAQWDAMPAEDRAAVLAQKGGWSAKSGALNVIGKQLAGKAWKDVPDSAKARIERLVAERGQMQADVATAPEQAPEAPASQPDVAGIDAAAHQAATSPQNDLPEPTQAQKEAGNYAKGHVRVHGMDITVENPRGSERAGTRPDGTAWRHTMSDHYGYIRRTEGADGEQVDVYVGPNPGSQRVFVVDQLDQQSGGFDEHKVMLGFDDEAGAVRAYRSNFDAGWKVGPVRAMDIDEFKAWLKDGDTAAPAAAPARPERDNAKTKPAAARKPRKPADPSEARWLEMTLAEREAVALSIGQRGIFAQKTAEKRWDRLPEKVRESLAAKLGAAPWDRMALQPSAPAAQSPSAGQPSVEAGKGAATPSGQSGSSVANPDADGAPDAIAPAHKSTDSGGAIADFGEKLGGARKDREAMRAAFDKVPTDAEFEHLPLSKLWPASEIDKIEDTFTAAVMTAARAEVPAKPRKSHRVRAWIEKVKLARSLVQRALGDVTRERFMDEMRANPALDGFRAKVALLEAIDRRHWNRIGEVEEHPDAYRYGEGGEKIPSPSVSVSIDDRRDRFDGAVSVADVLDRVRERLGDGPAEKQMQFDVYQRRGEFFIAKAGDKEKRALKTFGTAKEAMDYRKANHADLAAAWEAVKDRDNVKKSDLRRGENRERVGRDWRGGRDVTPEQFIAELGFRGVEFGNWVGQGKGAKERQGMLNQAYDALKDLADVVGIPPRAISLDGTLGLGFGSRGAGWASAHFEPGTLVINLTKTRGAGSLAHEWFHALDNYFARYRGTPTFNGNQGQYRREAFITYNPENYYLHKVSGTILPQRAFEVMIKGERHPEYGRMVHRALDRAQWDLKEGVRPEVGEAFADLVKSLNDSPMAARSALNDKSADGYWSRIIERGARAFEGFVIHRMALAGHQNDYLANVVPVEDFRRDTGRYPYLLDDEIAPVAEAFNALFATIQTRETERGTALFSFAGRSAAGADLHALGTAQRRIAAGEDEEAVRQDTGWHRGADGKWRFEISDDQAQLAVGGDTAAEVLEAAALDSAPVRVADVLDHPQLFAAYPHIADIRVELVPAGERAAGRMVRRGDDARLQLRGDLKRGAMTSVMLHELQHAIQHAEGFARGGSAKALASDLDRTGAETYLRLAGEVEARNTQHRQRMTAEQRRLIAPEDTADVSASDVIVTFNGMPVATAPRNAGSRVPVTERGLLRALRYQFRGLEGPVEAMLAKGRRGEKGGLVVVDSADPLRLAGVFSSKTGRTLDSSINLFSEGGQTQGLYDPKSGLTFLVGPNLDPVTAPAVLLHEMVHGQQRAKIDARAMDMLMNRGQVKDADLRAFLDRVAQRMVEADAASNPKEAAAYIVELAVIEGRSRGYTLADNRFFAWADATFGKGLGDLLRSVAAMVRTWMIRHGGIKALTVDDLVGYAMAGVERAAQGMADGKGGRSMGPISDRLVAGIDELHRRLTGEPVATLRTDEAPHQGKAKLREWAVGIFRDYGFYANNPQIGRVLMDERSVRDSLGHSLNPFKAVAFKAVPDVIEKGVIAHVERKGKIDSIYISAPVVINGADDIVTVLVHRDLNAQRMYLHSVTTKESLLRSSQSSAGAEAPGRSGTVISGGISTILRDALNFKDIQFSRAGTRSPQQIAKHIGDGLKSITVQDVKRAGRHKLTDWLKLGLQFLGRRQLVDIYGDVLPLAEYDRLAAQMEADKNDVGASADDLARRWGKLPDEGKLAELMHDATLAQIDADSSVPYAERDDRMKSRMLKGQFDALTPDAQKVYREARDHYRKHHAAVREAIQARIQRSELRSAKKAELLQRMDDDFFQAIKGVYFPLARFGQYVVVVKDGAGKVASVSRAETMAEAEGMRREMVRAFSAADGYQVGRVTLGKEFVASRDMVGRGFMTELYDALDQQNLPPDRLAELEDTLGQLYLSSLPDLSWAKHGIHRKGTPGFSQDARRAFAQNTFHGARYLAKLKYGDQMQTALDGMQKHVDQMSAIEDFDQPAAQRVVDEMAKRHDAMMNPKSNPLSTALTSFGFIYYLGLSPAAAVVNLSQTPLVAYPVLGAKWGFKKAGAALMQASREAVQGKNDMRGQLKNADEILAYDEAVRSGVIDVTMAHDLAGIAQGEDAKVMWKIRPVMRLASYLFHHAERFNRQTTFLAAYRLARETGAGHDAAYAQAVKATYDGHFDYSSGNRPRVMQGNVARVVLLFKQYAQNMIFTIARSAYQSVAGESPEVKREARKVFGALMTMHAAAAGVLGLPLVGTLLTMASALGGSDDEPWDAEVALRNMLADAFGPTVSEVIARGFSRLTPWDISGRVGLDKLLLPDVQEGLEGQRWAESVATAMLGPVIGVGVNAARGMQKMADGDYLRGIEDMLPVAARNPIKAYRYWEEGAQDRTGVAIKDEVSAASVLGQAAGFSPSEVRLAFEGRSAVMDLDRRLKERRSELMAQFARAAMDKDTDGMTEARAAIAEFNRANPGRRITPPQMWQSVRNRQRRIDQAEDGVYLPRTRRDALEAGRFAEG